VSPDPDWAFVAVAPREGDLRQQVYSMLEVAGYYGVADSDFKIDVFMDNGEDSVRVWVRSRATP
jgi:hypothetical protein